MHYSTSPTYRKAFQQYLRYGIPIEYALKSEEHLTTHYIWRTRHDGHVRASHAANEGKIFACDNPPPTGNPGDEYGCRCSAEPYIIGESEYAFQTLNFETENPKKWTDIDYIKHFYFDHGNAITLAETGNLSGLANYYLFNIFKNNHNSYSRINTQLIEAARQNREDIFNHDFTAPYGFGDYLYSFGGGTVSGNFSGYTKNIDGMIFIKGDIHYKYSDTFTDPLSIRQHILNNSEPLDVSLAYLFLSDVGGVFYDITGHWTANFEAMVKINPNGSKY